MKTETNSGKLKRAWWIIGLIVIVVIGLIIVATGEGEAEISIVSPGGTPSVYIDRTQKAALTDSGERTYSVSPGTRQVIVSRDGYWPWSDEVEARGNETTTVTPFLVQETPQSVLQTGESIQTNLTEAANTPVAASSSPAISGDEQMRAFVDGGTNLIAQWNQATSSAPSYLNCRGETCGVSVYNQAPITQVAFYPDRHDTLFFATETGVYAIEIDPDGATQNFQPVSENLTNPAFAIEGDKIYVQSASGVTVSDI